MLDRQTSGIDLPVKALAWQDEGGQVWLTYNDATWLAARHELGSGTRGVTEAINTGLATMAEYATAPKATAS